jgi:hypothetical protein
VKEARNGIWWKIGGKVFGVGGEERNLMKKVRKGIWWRKLWKLSGEEGEERLRQKKEARKDI